MADSQAHGGWGQCVRLPQRLSAVEASMLWVGYDQGVAMQETRGSGRGCGDIFFDEGATR